MVSKKQELNFFIEDLVRSHNENLVSVILYGSAATGDFQENVSDYDLLVVLRHVTPKDLRDAYVAAREWLEMGHRLPVYLTVSELKDAADVFPIEYHQMKKAHIVLFGEDILGEVDISDQNLRHQIEYELRGKLLRLRKLYIPACNNIEKLAELMVKSLSNFIALFRAVLSLHKIDAPQTKSAVINAMAQQFKINPNPFMKILQIRENGVESGFDEKMANELFTQYIAEIERVIKLVDKA
jgi:predicted nucleotidyltransferase